MGNHSSSTHHKKDSFEKLRHQLSDLGSRLPFGDDELMRVARCYCYLKYMSLKNMKDDLVTGKFLTDWAVFSSTLPGPDFHTTGTTTYTSLLSVDENMLSYELLNPEIERQRLTTSSIMKVTEEQILPVNFGEILYKVAFVDSNDDDDGSEQDEDREIARLAKFLDGLAECSRRGTRKALSVLFQCCCRMNRNMNPTFARAEDLVNTAYRIALSSEFLAASVEGEILDIEQYSLDDMDNAMQTSLLDFAIKSGMDSISTVEEGMVSLPVFIEWSETIFPCFALTLETYMHYIFFPDRPYPPSRTQFHLPSFDNCKSAFFNSMTLPTGICIRKSRMLFSFSCMSPMLCGSWHRIYTSDVDGLSFNRLLNSLLGYDGPTLIIIKESERKGIFGAYTNARWKESKDFCGNSDCFLFRLQPSAAVYRPRGTSSNYMYCNSESRSKGYDGLAHGIGFGGTSDSPRLFIAEKFEGCVASSNDLTFEEGNLLPPRIKGENSTKRFEIEALEVWGVGGQDAISDALQARNKQRDVTAANIRKARKVDKAAFLDDFKSGLLESKAFQHREQMRGREDCSTVDLDAEKK